MYALDAATGTILWSFASGGSVTGGASIADGKARLNGSGDGLPDPATAGSSPRCSSDARAATGYAASWPRS